MAGVDFALEVEGHRVATAKPEAARILPNAVAEMILPARVHWAEVAPSLAALFAQGQVHYSALGQLALGTDVGRVIIPLAHDGAFEAPKMPKFDVGRPRIAAITMSGARLSVPLQISNPNGFPLPIGGVLGDVWVAGANVGRVALPQAAAVPAGRSPPAPQWILVISSIWWRAQQDSNLRPSDS